MPRRRSGPLLCGVLMVVAGLAVVTGCGARPADTAPIPEPPTSSIVDSAPPPVLETSVTSSPAPAPLVPVGAVVDAAEGAIAPGMTLGVAVLDVDTGELVEGRLGRRPFMSASLSKLIVAVDMFDRRSTEGRAIAEPDLELVGRALSASDDGAMSALWGRYDGLGAVRRVSGRLGLTATRGPDDAGAWGDTVTAAGDVARIYQHILNDMAPGDSEVIVEALAAASPVAPDGFEQHFGLLWQGPSAQRYAKQAWVPWAPSGHLLHSAGVVHDARTDHDYAIALLSIQPYASRQLARDRLSTVAVAALGALGL